MCGRYTLTASRREIAELFEALPIDDVPEAFARYNLAPTQRAPIVRIENDRRVVAMARWGLIPSWVRDPATLKSDHINARAERAARSPMFKHALHRRRCLVPTNGFYEWQAQPGRAPKRPHLLRPRDAGLCAFAGVWEHWQSETGEPVESFTILTTDADGLVRPLHDRMPVILPRSAWRSWLDPAWPAASELPALLEHTAADDWEAVPVSRYVNSPAHDDPACIEPVTGDGGGQQRLF